MYNFAVNPEDRGKWNVTDDLFKSGDMHSLGIESFLGSDLACKIIQLLAEPAPRTYDFNFHSAHGVYRLCKIFFLVIERHVHESDENRHLHKWADYCGKSLAGVDTKNGDGHGDGELKVV